MTEENKRRNIGLEVDRGQRELGSAERERAVGNHDIAVARAYYAAMHYARALLLIEGLQAKTHGGTTHLLHANFVRTGRFPPEIAEHLSTLEARRLNADYDVAAVFTEAMSERAVVEARAFAHAVLEVLAALGYR